MKALTYIVVVLVIIIAAAWLLNLPYHNPKNEEPVPTASEPLPYKPPVDHSPWKE